MNNSIMLSLKRIGLLFIIIVMLFVGCSHQDGDDNSLDEPNTQDAIDVSGKQSDFESASPASGYGNNPPLVSTDEDTAASGDAEDADTAPSSDKISRAIEEADIIKIDGHYLYILNQFKGLMICNIGSPDAPEIVGQIAVTGYPLEMYLHNNQAYIIITKSDTYPQNSGNEIAILDGSSASSSGNSLVAVIDLNDKQNPQLATEFPLNGLITDSRIVGEILYLVSSETSYYYYDDDVEATSDRSQDTPSIYVTSIDISSPTQLEIIAQKDTGGQAKFIHVTDEAIFIASSMGYYRANKSTITYVDISDPGGLILIKGSIDVNGEIEDEYKLDYYNGYLRVCTYEWVQNGSATQGISNLYVIDTHDSENLKLVGEVELGKGEQLFATRFDKNLAYMVTFERIDPLWVIDLSDPTKPTIESELEVPGWSTHIVPMDDRLITLGVDDTNGRKVSVSLFDVSTPEQSKLVERLSFGDDSGWSTSSAYTDVNALTVIEELGLILLPYTTSAYENGFYKSVNRLQLIDYTKDSLIKRGWIDQNGSILRSQIANDRLFSISTDELQVIDASDRDNPKITASLILASNLIDFIPLENNYGVQVIYRYGESIYELQTVSLDDPNGKIVSQISIPETSYSTIVNHANFIYTITNIYGKIEENDTTTISTDEDLLPPGAPSKKSLIPYPSTEQYSRVKIYDFTDPLSPEERGSIEIPGSYYSLSSHGSGKSIYPPNQGNSIIQMDNGLMVFTHLQQNRYPYPLYGIGDDAAPNADSGSGETSVESSDGDTDTTETYRQTNKRDDSSAFNGIYIVDFSNPDAAKITASYKMDILNSTGFFAKGKILYFSYDELIKSQTSDQPKTKYYLGRIDMSTPDSPQGLLPINIPGICLDIHDDILYTLDMDWTDQYYNISYAFNTLKLENDKAYLLDRTDLKNYYPTNLIITDTYALIPTYSYYYYWEEDSQNENGNTDYDLILIDFTNPGSLNVYNHTLSAGYDYLLGVQNDKLFVNSQNSIIACDIANPEKFETIETKVDRWAYAIHFTDAFAYVPMGYYGLWVEPL